MYLVKRPVRGHVPSARAVQEDIRANDEGGAVLCVVKAVATKKGKAAIEEGGGCLERWVLGSVPVGNALVCWVAALGVESFLSSQTWGLHVNDHDYKHGTCYP